MLQRVNWPEKTAGYKIVQLYLDKDPYLRFGNPELMHGQILASFLDACGIKYITKRNRAGILIPEPEGGGYRAAGMGFATVMPKQKRAYFNADSADYLIGINLDHLQKIRELEPEWTLKRL